MYHVLSVTCPHHCGAAVRVTTDRPDRHAVQVTGDGTTWLDWPAWGEPGWTHTDRTHAIAYAERAMTAHLRTQHNDTRETPMKNTTDRTGLVISNHPYLYERMCEYAADNPGDLAQAASDYCENVLAPIFTEGWMPKTGPRDQVDAATALIREVMPTGTDPDTVEMVEELMAQAVAE